MCSPNVQSILILLIYMWDFNYIIYVFSSATRNFWVFGSAIDKCQIKNKNETLLVNVSNSTKNIY
jgi:hypothetical protein